MKKVMVTMPEILHEALREYADETGASISGLMRIMAIEWLRERGREVELPSPQKPGRKTVKKASK